MKMNKKGFTLIELLAVIVVLAIIALIATPIVMNTIKKAQIGADARSVEGYAKALEAKYYEGLVLNQGYTFASASADMSTKDYNGAVVTCATKSADGEKITLGNCTVAGGSGEAFNYADGKATQINK